MVVATLRLSDARVVSLGLLFGDANALGFGGGGEAWVGYHVMDRVAGAGDDHLQVDRGLVAVGDGECAGAVRVHYVGAGV